MGYYTDRDDLSNFYSKRNKNYHRKSFSEKFKTKLLKRYKGKCGICNKPLNLIDVTIDHIKPLSKGGTNAHSNIQPAHNNCNVLKADKEDFTIKN